MTDQQQDHPPPSRYAMTQWAVDIIRSLSLQNILILALLIMVSIPAWFAWRFMNDTQFRHEFMSTSRTIDMKVPCLVVVATSYTGKGDQYTVATQYDFRNRLEFLVGVRSPGILSDSEVATYCALMHEHSAIMRQSLMRIEEEKQRNKP